MKILNLLIVFFSLVLVAPSHAAEKIYFVHTDHLGTPQGLTDDAQITVWKAGKDPFGNAAPTIELVTNNIRFPGQYYDAETGLHYNWNRYYDPKTGRYVTSDPIGLQGGLNTFGYGYQNPNKYVDPDGRLAWVLIPLFGGGSGTGTLIGGGALIGGCIALGPCNPLKPLQSSPSNIFPSATPKDAANDDEFCGPDDDDPCQEWHDELLELYGDIVSGRAAASDVEKHLYNKSVDSYHANCPGYPKLSKF